ncbi:universal stress protein [Actinoplanes regularis]|uniref:Nucleotide-binding universal stress protein, UspA family n=1 Tax=Actinoplanes regularis TaxID=52697 RepID=A0A239FBE0_9ACTN|nr:universal stress protein [Actinoplanes regularis]GIE92494.1 hypothetical protein Are01nite_89740 [Actinoplanes regularis]SNS53404.1 Nucleotide-binding universal stress protein, UspA family [Actinoplanes regularis]
MSDLGYFKVEQQARQRHGDLFRVAPCTEMINSYLGTFSYADPYEKAPAVEEERAAVRTVVVGVDDLPAGRVAVDQAAIEAKLLGSALLIVHAGAPRHPSLLDGLVQRVRLLAPDLEVTTRVTAGMRPAEMLLSTAGENDLIVLGHRQGFARRTLRCGVAERVVAQHPGPVLVVRRTGWPPPLELENRQLLVGMRGSAASSRAYEFAVAEAQARGCDIVVLHVVPGPVEVPEWLDWRGGVAVWNRTVAGNPVNELVDAASHADAMVLGRSAGRGRLGSVDRAVLHHGRCPVFFVG